VERVYKTTTVFLRDFGRLPLSNKTYLYILKNNYVYGASFRHRIKRLCGKRTMRVRNIRFTYRKRINMTLWCMKHNSFCFTRSQWYRTRVCTCWKTNENISGRASHVTSYVYWVSVKAREVSCFRREQRKEYVRVCLSDVRKSRLSDRA